MLEGRIGRRKEKGNEGRREKGRKNREEGERGRTIGKEN